MKYSSWWLLDAPQSGIRIEVLNIGYHLTRYIDPAFSPCAVACTNCGDREEFLGLKRAGEFDSITLFLNPESGKE